MFKKISKFLRARKETKKAAVEIEKLLYESYGDKKKIPLKKIKSMLDGIDGVYRLPLCALFQRFVRDVKNNPPLDYLDQINELMKIFDIEGVSAMHAETESLEEGVRKAKRMHEISTAKSLPIVDVDVILKEGEEAYFDVVGTFYEERTRRLYRGGSAGTSIRVAKGVSFRVGANKGNAVNEDYLKEIDTGEFIITNKRMVFVGSDKSWNIVLKKLMRIQDTSVDGNPALSFSTETTTKKKIISFNSEDEKEEAQAILNRIVKSGDRMKSTKDSKKDEGDMMVFGDDMEDETLAQ